MAILAKVNKLAGIFESGKTVIVRAQDQKGVTGEKPNPQHGEHIYVWTSESHGGIGLTAFGSVVSAKPVRNVRETQGYPYRGMEIEFLVEKVLIESKLKIADCKISEPEVYKLIGRQPHEKIVEISAQTALSLNTYFE